ncbi:phosphoglycolate phosphatase [Thecamonas trahens ATCC 50062]|uniref:Phosphoglycolate phosphatase n=1 Tax=Thecamonas trahens ATCC 50062 TaxID=461836 RepID=A0A0L0DJ49_THETB|nr:phosphoglycolate phosphatase [Thecamonas trahens ATCC 50062]KNC52429.1 phosphoglycolate phosphatase [Thecamonas trahens ATCC 50062]|eukprot:XP_013755470.1 phosphoglycolate phosphatase [Thecamonas trahens ATCC 50062]
MTHLDDSPTATAELLTGIKAVVFDCDGVIWRGTKVIPGALATVAALEAAGVAVYFVTNNSTRSRAMYMDKFAAKGMPHVRKDQILSASYAAAAYLQSIDFDGAVYVVGEVGILEELEEAGIPAIGGPDQPPMTLAELEVYKPDPSVSAVVVGADTGFSYTKAAIAQQYLLARPDNLFIATNPDTSFPTQGNFLPGAGMAVAAVEACASRKATIVGKPAPFLLHGVLDRLAASSSEPVDRSSVLMVGDRLDTDILFGSTV